MDILGNIGKNLDKRYHWDEIWSKLRKILGKTPKNDRRNNNTYIEAFLLNKLIHVLYNLWHSTIVCIICSHIFIVIIEINI